jgi:hypothetical protein
MSNRRRDVQDAIETIRQSEQLSIRGETQRVVYNGLAAAVGRLQTQPASVELDFQKALGSGVLGGLARELDMSAAVAYGHHQRAYYYAAKLNDHDLAFQAALSMAHCAERIAPELVARNLVLGQAIHHSHGTAWQEIYLLVRQAELLDLSGSRESAVSLYRHNIMPVLRHVDNLDPLYFCIVVVAYVNLLIHTHGEEAWQMLENSPLGEVATYNNLIGYQVLLQRGRLLLHAGDLSGAENRLRLAERLRLAHDLTPKLSAKLRLDLSAASG